jgi:hypothetical protein
LIQIKVRWAPEAALLLFVVALLLLDLFLHQINSQLVEARRSDGIICVLGSGSV